ncbi:hypothetical protein RWC52_000294 [Pseudomonas aeruginosa]|nr:hypothetical protein [Pseudomonas aeruginosa]
MSNELTDVRCPCGDEYPADSYDAGFIAGSGMCQNCDAALPPKDICTCPSGDGPLRHPCPAHPAVEQAGGDERDFQAEGAQEVPSPVSQEYDRHLISLLRKGEALPGHQEEAADEIERLRDWNDHLNNTVLPNILNPNFLMLMKGGERLLDLCTKDGKFIGVSLNDMKDVFDWMVTHARIAPDHAALAQPSPKCATCNGSKVVSTTDTDHNGDYIEAPCPKCGGTGEADSGGVHPWGEPVLIPCDCETEKAEAERPVVVARLYRSNDLTMTPFAEVQKPLPLPASDGTLTVDALMTVAQHERIVGALRAENAKLSEALDECDGDRWKLRSERDAANARLHEVATACATAEQERDAALARVADMKTMADNYCALLMDANAKLAEMERQEPVATVAKVPGEDWNSLDFHRDLQDMQPGTKLYAAPVAQAQHSVPEEFIGRLSGFLAQRGTTGKALLRELRAMLAAAPAQGGE